MLPLPVPFVAFPGFYCLRATARHIEQALIAMRRSSPVQYKTLDILAINPFQLYLN